jgi:hypothetical protein
VDEVLALASYALSSELRRAGARTPARLLTPYTEEIIATVHARRAPMMSASAGLQI